jgi:CheY-like chemotaxis protein
VACRTLEKIGYRVDIAVDGQAAVESWKTGRYDLILMDCQMPVMDGYEATRAIRALEKQDQKQRTPIVALTAHAMKGIDQDCLDAGMDAYLSKPIDRAQLEAGLEKFLGAIEQPVFETTGVIPKSEAPELLVEWDRLIAAADGNEKQARKLARLFFDQGQAYMDSITAALHAGNYLVLAAQARLLKNAAAYLQAPLVVHAASLLEAAVSTGDLTQILELTESLRWEMERVLEYLKHRVS